MESTRILSAGDLARPEDPLRTRMAPSPGAEGVTLSSFPSSSHALSIQPSRAHWLFRLVTGGPPSSAGRRPLNLCLAIDRSGSMEGEPLDYVKQACGHILDLLGPEDVLSIVTFEDAVDVVVPARRVMNRDLLRQHVQRIVAGRTTNLYDGLVAACAQVASAASPQSVSRVLLLTDGEPTAGIRDFQSIVNLVADKRNQGIVVTALGFGPEYNEELLAGMARRGGGSYHYIPRPELIPEVFRKELQSLMTVQATDVRLSLALPRWVSVRQVYGRQATFAERGVVIALPDLESGSTLSVLAEVEYQPRPAGTYRVASAELIFSQGGTQASARADVLQQFTPDPAQVTAGTDPEVQREVELAQASVNLERTVMGMRTQQISAVAAMAELEKTQSFLAQRGRAEEATQIGQVLSGLRAGSTEGAEKTLVGTILELEKGKS